MTMWKATHYGVDVTAQYIDGRFKEILREHGIKYTESPILTHDVIEYDTNDKHKYACIEPYGENLEYVCITERIPLDLDWKALMDDCREQGTPNHKEPQKLETKAHKIIEEAAYYSLIDDGNPFNGLPEIDYNMMKFYITINLGIGIEELMAMDLMGIDEDILDKIKNAKISLVGKHKYLNYKSITEEIQKND